MITLDDINRLVLALTVANSLFLLFDFTYLARRPGLPECYRYNSTSTFSNLLIDRIHWAIMFLLAQPTFLFFSYIESHSLRWIPWPATHPAHVLTAFLMGDLAYYLWHRASHEYGLLWFGHQVHHQDTHLNASTGNRTGWVGTLFFLPFLAIPVFLGVSKSVFLAVMVANGLFMWFTHSSIGRLPKGFELILNSPSSHRMHHHFGPRSGRCNYGEVLIIWDRIFGTFRPEKKLTTRFGVKGVPLDFRPVSYQLKGLFPRIMRFDAGHEVEEIFSIHELIVLSISLLCIYISRLNGDYFSLVSLLVLVLGAEFYPKMNRGEKILFWALDLALAGVAVSSLLYELAHREIVLDFRFISRLAGWSLVFALAPWMYRAGRKAGPVVAELDPIGAPGDAPVLRKSGEVLASSSRGL